MKDTITSFLYKLMYNNITSGGGNITFRIFEIWIFQKSEKKNLPYRVFKLGVLV